jgi:4Fe-4S ferredoxin
VTDEEKTLEVTREMDVDGSRLIYRLKTDRGVKTLAYDYKRCTGCGICVDICPAEALELGPTLEIATGLDAPPVMVDQDKCTFCSMCANFCPVRAFRMETEGEFPEEELYPVLEMDVAFNDRCLPCEICKVSCPEEAIDVEYAFPVKEDIAPFEEGHEGDIEVDMDKCTLCGLCARFCDAFLLPEKEAVPEDPFPFGDLLVDEDRCDYCVLCADLCPEDAITVKGERRGEAPAIAGKAVIDEVKCTLCGWCEVVCPYDAVDISRPFDGELRLIEANVPKCDPSGCHGCFNVCPSHLWYVPEKGPKIAARDELCTHCGACVNACPEDVMAVYRSEVRHSSIPDSPWASQWRDAVAAMKGDVRRRPDISRIIEVEEEPPRQHAEIQLPEVDGKLMEAVRERIAQARPKLRNAGLRKKWERTDAGDGTGGGCDCSQ